MDPNNSVIKRLWCTMCLKIAAWVANSVEPDETQHSTTSHLGLHCLLRPEKICCGYLLEVSPWGASNEYPQHRFLWRNKKMYSQKPVFIYSYEKSFLLTLGMLVTIFSRWHIGDIFANFPWKQFLKFLISSGGNLHEMLKLFFWES